MVEAGCSGTGDMAYWFSVSYTRYIYLLKYTITSVCDLPSIRFNQLDKKIKFCAKNKRNPRVYRQLFENWQFLTRPQRPIPMCAPVIYSSST